MDPMVAVTFDKSEDDMSCSVMKAVEIVLLTRILFIPSSF